MDDENSIELWWMLKIDIYAFVVALCFILAAQKPNDNVRLKLIERFIMDVGIGLAVSNVIDRRLYDVRGYRIMDLAMGRGIIGRGPCLSLKIIFSQRKKRGCGESVHLMLLGL